MTVCHLQWPWLLTLVMSTKDKGTFTEVGTTNLIIEN